MLSLHNLLRCSLLMFDGINSVIQENVYQWSRIFEKCVPGIQSVLFCLSLHILYQSSGYHFFFKSKYVLQIIPLSVTRLNELNTRVW